MALEAAISDSYRRKRSISVETTVSVRLCHTTDAMPYWHVSFALHNRCSAKVVVLGLTIRPSFGDQGPFKSIKWPDGDVILDMEGSFAGLGVNVPCNNTCDPPSFAVKWQYRKVMPVEACGAQHQRKHMENHQERELAMSKKYIEVPMDRRSSSHNPEASTPPNLLKRLRRLLEQPLCSKNKRLKGEE